ncbi:MAG: DALR domain-containing protein, partial [Acidimicrobiaceae bacterium]
THYRSPVKVGLDNIDASVNALAGIDSFAARTSSLTATPDVTTLDAFRAAMNDDLNTPVAMGVLFDAVRRANVAVDAGDNQSAASVASAVREMCIAVGLQLDVAQEVGADAQAKATALDAARAAKDFATADKLRAELQALGYLVETTKAGTTLRRG